MLRFLLVVAPLISLAAALALGEPAVAAAFGVLAIGMSSLARRAFGRLLAAHAARVARDLGTRCDDGTV